MNDDVFRQLADALDRLPNGFPSTPTGLEIRILKKIFTPEEAEWAVRLTPNWEPVDEIAARLGLPEKEVIAALKPMAARGLIWGGV